VIAPVDKAAALLAGITRAEVEALPPAHRQRLAQALRRVADFCDPPAALPKEGVLARLGQGERGH
jgi:hypothetical protein